jgi:hypothetical protein
MYTLCQSEDEMNSCLYDDDDDDVYLDKLQTMGVKNLSSTSETLTTANKA